MRASAVPATSLGSLPGRLPVLPLLAVAFALLLALVHAALALTLLVAVVPFLVAVVALVAVRGVVRASAFPATAFRTALTSQRM